MYRSSISMQGEQQLSCLGNGRSIFWSVERGEVVIH